MIPLFTDCYIYIRKLKEIHNILSINRLWRTRLYEIGIVIKDSCLYSGVIGLLSCLIKIIIDARFTGYEVYEELNYPISYPSIGDCLDRYIPIKPREIKSLKLKKYYRIIIDSSRKTNNT